MDVKCYLKYYMQVIIILIQKVYSYFSNLNYLKSNIFETL